MRTFLIILSCLLSVFSAFYCPAQQNNTVTPKVLYQSDRLIVTQLTDNTFEHTSYKQTQDFGNVPCNGVLVRGGTEVIVFDTPTDDQGSEELIQWVTGTLHCKISAVIPTHFHDDCLGGLKAFEEHQIPSYASYKTIELAKAAGSAIPKNGFNDSLVLKVGKERVTARFFGEGHTKDNVVGYFPRENVLFGGCLIKEMDASKGYLGDANLAEWSGTVKKVKKAYPKVKLVVPGHGDYGDKKLLDYTIQLFKVNK